MNCDNTFKLRMKFPINLDFSHTSVYKFFEDHRNIQYQRTNNNNNNNNLNNRPLRISDLRLKAKQDELLQINKISTKGTGITKGVTLVQNDFTLTLGDLLDVENLSFNIEGPSYIKLNHQKWKNGKVKVSYRVGIPGEYFFHIKYKNLPVPKSPFLIQVTECKKPPVPVSNFEAVTAYGKGLQLSRQGEVSSFKVDISKTGNKNGRLGVYVDSPDLGIDCEIRYISSKTGCKVEYVCPVEGVYFARVKYNGKNIPGSPFQLNCVSATNNNGNNPPGRLSSLRFNNDDDRRRRWPLFK